MPSLKSLLVLSTLALSGVRAHPGHNVLEEAAERAEYLKLKPRTVRDCSAQLERRGHAAASIKRRKELADRLRAARGLNDKAMIRRRDFSSYDFSHQSTESYNQDTDMSTIFADNSSCTLQSEVTQGPYYVNGELIRQDVTEGQEGVPLYLDIQIIDTSSCEPVSDVYMDLWHCNATGVYSGVVANGNGDSSDASNINNTALRGIQQTDSDGTLQFQTLFPGHYSGRATHIHIMTHNSASTQAASNNTLLASDDVTHASHVGQLFFDQDLISQMDEIAPYSTNTQTVTLNSADNILAQEADTTDPFVEYVLLGDSLSDGLLGWISIGIDPTADSEVNAASTNYETGGVSNGNSMGGDGGSGPGSASGNSTNGGGPPSGTMSGSPPGGSGTAPSGSASAGAPSSGAVTTSSGATISSSATRTSTTGASTTTIPASLSTGGAALSKNKDSYLAYTMVGLLAALIAFAVL